MVPQWVGVLVLVLPVGLVLGYWSALPRVKRLERELAQLLPSKSLKAQVLSYSALLAKEKAQALVLQSALDSAQVRVSDSELELVRVKAQLVRAELALEELRYRNQETDWKGYH
jgi:hypothetical protein